MAAKRCCFSDQFHSKVMQVMAVLPQGATVPVISESNYNVDYDFNAKMDRTVGTSFNTTTASTSNFTRYTDFKNHRLFTVTSHGCTMETYMDPMGAPCISEHMTYFGSYNFSAGYDRVVVNQWAGVTPTGYRTQVHVTEHDCSLVAVMLYGLSPTQMMLSRIYANVVQDSLSQPNILVLPSACTALIHETVPVG